MERYYPLGAGRTVTSPFGPRTGGFHTGVDFGRTGGSAGMPVYAIQAGTVIYAGAAGGYGGPDPAGWLVIDSDDAQGGGCLEYGHIVREVAAGARVRAGQRIGYINPDRATNAGVAPHLHVSDMPRGYDPSAKQNPLIRLAGASEPDSDAPPTPTTQETNVGFVGDPVWLPEVLRNEGANVVEYPGWRDRGHGDFKDIRGVMVHHTGSDTAAATSIANGRPDLPSPLSQIHIGRDGVVTVVAAGVAWHAGVGSYPWLPTNMANWHMIGIECANSGTNPRAAHRENWPVAQYDALLRCCNAINRRLGYGAERVIGHKEYAGARQGKWDPGAIDMDILRDDMILDGPPVIAPSAPSLPPVGAVARVLLYRGMPGPNAQVTELQRRLADAYGHTHGKGLKPDGWFGQLTELSVRSFQRAVGLTDDGIVGPTTAAALRLKVM